MSKEKQIAEMAKAICGYYGVGKCYDRRYCCDCRIKHDAEALYDAGYRKQSEVIDNFAIEVKAVLDDTYSTGEDALIDICDLIDYIAQKMKGGAE